MALKGIVIDPGHGGEDPGASGNGIIEKDLNLDISKYMYERFKELGVPVTITRDDDETLSPTERVKRILAAYGNDPNVVVISNHINASGGDGAEVIYALRNTSKLANLVLQSLEKEGQNIRKAYQRRLPSNTALDYYFIQRDTGKTEPITVEYGFLDSDGDDVNQLKTMYLDYAEAVVRAVMQYLNLPYTPPTGEKTYTVKSGDSLYQIANKLGVSIESLIQANNLSSNLLSIGQILVIPDEVKPQEYGIYTVSKGDTLYGIASKNNLTVNELLDFNNLSSTKLSVGQQLFIPGSTTQEDTSKEVTYTVKSGDTLYSIAKKYNLTVDDLVNENSLNSTNLSIGQILTIPLTTKNTYVVKSGDSLWSIARKFNITVDELKEKNKLASNLLSIGQILTI